MNLNKRERSRNWFRAVCVIVIQAFLLSNVTYAAGVFYNNTEISADKAMLSPSLGIPDMKSIFTAAMKAKLSKVGPAEKTAATISIPQEMREQAKQRSILIVEDDEEQRKLAAEYFKGKGYDVWTADSVKEVLKIAKGRFDVVLTDYHLPDGTGKDVAKAIRENNSETPIMLWSGKLALLSEDEISAVNPVRAFKKGIVGLLEKIFKEAEAIIDKKEQEKNEKIEAVTVDRVATNQNYRILDILPKLTEALKSNGNEEVVLFHGVVNVKSNAQGTIDDAARLDNMDETLKYLLNNKFTPILVGHKGVF